MCHDNVVTKKDKLLPRHASSPVFKYDTSVVVTPRERVVFNELSSGDDGDDEVDHKEEEEALNTLWERRVVRMVVVVVRVVDGVVGVGGHALMEGGVVAGRGRRLGAMRRRRRIGVIDVRRRLMRMKMGVEMLLLLLMVVVGSAVGYAVVVYPSQGVVVLPGAASAPLALLRRSCVVVRLTCVGGDGGGIFASPRALGSLDAVAAAAPGPRGAQLGYVARAGGGFPAAAAAGDDRLLLLLVGVVVGAGRIRVHLPGGQKVHSPVG